MIDILNKIFFRNKYKKKFHDEAIKRVIIQNIIDADQYYLNEKMTLLLEKMLFKYKTIINNLNKLMIVLIIPQRYDLLLLKKRNYQSFYKKISKNISVIDLTDAFLRHDNIESLYLNDNYAGHLSSKGNKLVANEIHKYIEKGIFK